jgi:beta-lactam-binding protein with PASTA domain
MLKRVLAYILIAIATIVGMAFLLNLLMTLFVGGRQVTVPDVRGMEEGDAALILSDNGLRYEVIGEQFSVEYPESTVSVQDPPPGQVVKQGRKIVVTLSRGGEYEDVPYCIGRPFRTVLIDLERAGFYVGNVTRAPSRKGYPEEVLSTEPLPGRQAVKGSPVNILVNDGPPRTRVLLPDLRGESYITVKMRLERLGLFVRESSLDDEFNPLRSKIVMHEPTAGHIVSRGDTVSLIITIEERKDYSL